MRGNLPETTGAASGAETAPSTSVEAGGAAGAAGASWLDALNPAQREAVEATEGPVLVLAGAGTGKTRVLTTRLAHILASGRAWPRQVLAVTFTNRAAMEMRDRVAALVGPAAEGIWLGTFHALGARILRRHAELAGLRPDFTILDADDQIRLLKQLLEAENIDTKKSPARVLAGIIQRWKDRGLGPEQVGKAEAGEFAGGRALDIYRQYQARLRTLNAADFGDLLLHCLTVFTGNPEVLAAWRERFRYILVDEYQDTNVAQYLWLRLLARESGNLCCVGDDDQSIYSWRGAEVGNILRFERDFEGARIVRLEQNYRSGGHILGAASGLIAKNEGRLGKTLWTEAGAGEPVMVRPARDGQEEARAVCEEIEALHRDGGALSEIAILVRAGFQMREFEERLLTLDIPYRVVGGPRFYERREIRDAVAWLRVIRQPDDDPALERIINTPRRGIGEATLRTLHAHARGAGVSLFRAAGELVQTDELPGRARNSLRDLLAMFARWRGAVDSLPHTELAELVLDESGYTAMWQNDRSPDAPGRLENLRELVTAMAEFDNLAGFLEHISLVMEAADRSGGDRVSLMTLHGAKGLEFDTVFLPGWEEGLFPHQRALDADGGAGLEEERRLAYVGLTRARKRAIVCFAAVRQIHGQWQGTLPSRFVDELPREHVAAAAQGVAEGAVACPAADEAAEDGWTPMNTRVAALRQQFRGGGGLVAARDPAPRAGGQAGAGGATSDLAIGDRVFHQKFGYGRVTDIDGHKLSINFEHAGDKRVMDSFVRPA